MKPLQMKRAIEERITNKNWVTSYDRESESLRVIDKRYNKGVTINLSSLKNKFESNKEKALEEVIHYVSEGLSLLERSVVLKGNEKNIFPVIRSTSFPTEVEDGREFIYSDHTAETRVFYVIDHGASYSLIDKDTLEKDGKTLREIEEMALFNVRSLPYPMKEDEVAGNKFYFLHTDDGYDASRIMNEPLLKEMERKVEGDLAVAVPHQDVLIFADLRNETGYDVLAQMVFQFFSEGRVPITALPFLYENGELEPIFILARRKPKEKK
ncbi:uncharacterized protein YtpQ (UPF0354 family) [Evansella vedderi]|uniref:UPF0354 protein J2S74_002370 n=1 Tax=Evansella vedderi TaxID=38282 RepID=A0ABT9ZUR9_9BACI|nr:DUF1444 domain-containing protein [Evansella vedderi]MDQ0254988.1 uncharacterized protein YtpQ (UPF0354 family) [Evansella vedderi]